MVRGQLWNFPQLLASVLRRQSPRQFEWEAILS
jgi:hypothetical protein